MASGRLVPSTGLGASKLLAGEFQAETHWTWLSHKTLLSYGLAPEFKPKKCLNDPDLKIYSDGDTGRRGKLLMLFKIARTPFLAEKLCDHAIGELFGIVQQSLVRSKGPT